MCDVCLLLLLLLLMQIDYPPFEKNFYIEHEELSSLNGTQTMELRQKLNLRVSSTCVCVDQSVTMTDMWKEFAL